MVVRRRFAEPDMVGLIEEAGAARGMPGGKDNLYLPAAEIEHLSVLQVIDLSLVVSHELGNIRCISRIYPDFREIVDGGSCMVRMDMGSDESDGL